MIQVSPGATIHLVGEPIKMNSRLKGTLGICRDILNLEPMNGGYVVFRNASGDRLRILFYDGDGWWLCEKIFSSGRLRYWSECTGVSEITARELAVLLWRGSPAGAKFPEFWKKVG